MGWLGYKNLSFEIQTGGPHTRLGAVAPSIYANSHLRRLFLFLHWESVYIYFTERKSLLNSKQEKKKR